MGLEKYLNGWALSVGVLAIPMTSIFLNMYDSYKEGKVDFLNTDSERYAALLASHAIHETIIPYEQEIFMIKNASGKLMCYEVYHIPTYLGSEYPEFERHLEKIDCSSLGELL